MFNISREEYIKNKPGKKNKRKCSSGKKAFWVAPTDPRMPSQRSIISRNYHILESDPIAAKLLPRENLVSGNSRGKNLCERISPTNPKRPNNDHSNNDKPPRGCF